MEKINTVNGILGQKTRFGWIVSGNITRAAKQKIISAITTINLKDLEADETITDNADCERKFKETTVINEEGRFVVSIPFHKEAKLRDSHKQAMARLMQMEKKFQRNPKNWAAYNEFMKEYLKMGHMVSVKTTGQGKYYLPHQAIIRPGSLTTKLRVVFDA